MGGTTTVYRDNPQTEQKLRQIQSEKRNAQQKWSKKFQYHQNQQNKLLKQLIQQGDLKYKTKQQEIRKQQQQIRDQLRKQYESTKLQFQNRQKKMRQSQTSLQSQIKIIQGQARSKIEELQKQLKEIQDPEKTKIHVSKMKQLFWDDLNNQKFELHKGKSVIFIGRTSVGKSSLVNTLFKTKVPTSKMSCTQEISVVITYGSLQQNNLVSIFDCPGLDEHFDLINDPYKIPKFMGCMSDIYYLYDGMIQPDILKTFMAMNKKIYAVRTKCDPDQAPEENQEVRARDYSALLKIGIKTEIFLTSKKGGVDNAKLLKHILQ